jgi:single-stranded DNA-binding protein
MVTASAAVDVNCPGEAEETEWFSLIGFGKAADELARHGKGDLLAIMGTLTRSRFIGLDGVERSGWSLTVEALLSARTERPGGRRQQNGRARPASGGTGARMPNDGIGDLWPN